MARSVPTYSLYGETTATEPDFWLHVETIPSRSSLHHWEIRLHRHESFFQILYIAGGSGDALFPDGSHRLDPPSMVTVPPSVDHGFRFSPDIDGYVFTILANRMNLPLIGAGRAGAFLSQPHVTPLAAHDSDAHYLAETLDRFGREWLAGGGGRSDLLEAYLTTALTLAARRHPGDAGMAIGTEAERRVDHFATLLNRHCREHKDAAFYARALGITPTHLNRVTRKVAGVGAHDFIAGKLVAEARRDLVFSIGTIQDVADRLGFADPAYFSRFFQRRTGMTPKSFRQSERARLSAQSSE